MNVILKLIGITLAVDFATGLIHWLEESFWSPETPILGKWLVIPNRAHHQNGQDFLQKSWFQSSWDLLILGILIVLSAYFLHHLSWEVLVFSILVINANQIHKWAHITRNKDKPRIVAFLQKIYVLQRTTHHGQHHRKPNMTHYCIITNFLNPILDTSKFWRGLEHVLGKEKMTNARISVE